MALSSSDVWVECAWHTNDALTVIVRRSPPQKRHYVDHIVLLTLSVAFLIAAIRASKLDQVQTYSQESAGGWDDSVPFFEMSIQMFELGTSEGGKLHRPALTHLHLSLSLLWLLSLACPFAWLPAFLSRRKALQLKVSTEQN